MVFPCSNYAPPDAFVSNGAGRKVSLGSSVYFWIPIAIAAYLRAPAAQSFLKQGDQSHVTRTTTPIVVLPSCFDFHVDFSDTRWRCINPSGSIIKWWQWWRDTLPLGKINKERAASVSYLGLVDMHVALKYSSSSKPRSSFVCNCQCENRKRQS